MQLRHKFFLVLGLLSGVPLLILLFGVVDRVEDEVKSRTASELHANLDKMAGELEVLLNSQKSIANGLAKVPAITRFAEVLSEDSTDQYDARATELERFFLNYQHAVPSIQALRFIDGRGKTLVKVKEGKPVEPAHFDPVSGRHYIADQSSKRFYQVAVQGTEDVMMSDFELGQVTRDADFCPAMLRYSVLVRDALDTPEGLLVVNMWGTRVDRTVEASLGGYPGHVYIVELNPGTDRDGIYLYHQDPDRRFGDQTGSGYRLTAELTAGEWSAIRNAERYGSLYRDDGRMLFFRKFEPYRNRPVRWLLVIETDADTLLAPIHDLRRSIWLLLGALLLVSLLVASWAALRLSRPAHALADVITRYADGNHGVRYRDRRRDEIGAAGRAFNYLAASLERAERDRDQAEQAVRQSERLAAVGQLAAGISHEINNPLMNIMSLASLVENSLDASDEQAVSDLKLLQSEGQRCARIVQGILNFARKSKPCYAPFDLAALLADTLVLMRHRIEVAEICVHREFAECLPMEGDPNLLQQVLVNVLLNAIQASPLRSTITVSARIRGERVCVSVLDEGPGLPEGELAQVFDPFFTTKAEGEGTGLGLSVSYGIVKDHGGEIRTENTPAGGLCLQIELPVSQGRRAPEQQPQEQPQEGGPVHAV